RGGLSLDTLSAPRIEATLRRSVMATIDKALLDAAWETVRPVVRWTPMLRSDHVDSLVGARVFLKAESLQLAGSFKMRGACFRVSRLSPDERGRGVVAFSSGNFAQALALAGRLAGVPVTIVMPCDAPERKVELTRRAGATVVLTDHGARNREEVANARAHEIAAEEGRVFLHPFDDPLVVAGQSTLMREVQLDAERERVRFDCILCPVGGGGAASRRRVRESNRGAPLLRGKRVRRGPRPAHSPGGDCLLSSPREPQANQSLGPPAGDSPPRPRFGVIPPSRP